MSSIATHSRRAVKSTGTVPEIPPLEAGDRLDRSTFHARYEAMPEDVRAELIGGTVYIPSPLKLPHGRADVYMNRWLSEYEDATPRVEAVHGASAFLADDSEPQPDLSLLLDPARGGQTREEDEYIIGCPELVIEIASSTESYDLHSKKDDYERYGAKEYLVVALRQAQVFWFISRNGKFEPLPTEADGILRSQAFPGLWLDAAALLRRDRKRLLEILRQGIASPDHADFVAKLTA